MINEKDILKAQIQIRDYLQSKKQKELEKGVSKFLIDENIKARLKKQQEEINKLFDELI
jgi:hypothetical protein